MRGGALNDMSSMCVQGGILRSLGQQTNAIMKPSSPMSASQFNSVLTKHKSIDQEKRHDSNINFDDGFNSSTSESDQSEDIQSFPPGTTLDIFGDVSGDYMLTQRNNSTHKVPADPFKTIGFGKCFIEIEGRDGNSEQVSKINSHEKLKTFKCKQCEFEAIIKEDLWIHAKEHIPPEKRLPCNKCPFVTEYKHHLEYHIRNHVGSKPFKCTECNYSCVNKSMLNSHLKSHSNVHQYNCLNCSYNSKYCHSLKLHLRKYKHKPGIVLNPDGTPNPLPIIDVYGTRRGPKVKVQERKSIEESLGESQWLPLFHQIMLNTPHLQLPITDSPFTGYTIFPGFRGTISNPILLQNLEKLIKETQNCLQTEINSPEGSVENSQAEMEVLDLSKPEVSRKNYRRKGRAFKLNLSEENCPNEDETVMFPNVEVVERQDSVMEQNNEDEMLYNNKDNYSCQYCKIDFGDAILYTIHMGYHDFNSPFRCNMCGEVCEDKVAFFLHIARTSHS